MISTERKSTDIQEKKVIQYAIANALNQGHSFSLWKTPGLNEKYLIINQRGVHHLDEINLEESETGFVFAPFLTNKKKVFLPADVLYHFENGVLTEGPAPDSTYDYPVARSWSQHCRQQLSVSSPDYKHLVELGLRKIASSNLEKIVPSRFKDINLPQTFDPLNSFDKLCEKHPMAMVSLVSSTETGTWLGATPELLVSVGDNKFKTVALAGTLPYSPEINLKSVAWTQKEIEEQAFVCRYIINCFKKIRLREYDEHGPKTTVAGNVMHLKTEYEVDMLATNFPQLGSVMLKLLHPTSAVCGMPLENALAFLKEHEGYDREYYSGYLGPVNVKNESNIYVNLRCLQLFKDAARIYAGAGVTADSVSDLEWNETEMKMLNLQTIINQ